MKSKIFDSTSIVEKIPLNPQSLPENRGLHESFDKLRSRSIASIESVPPHLEIAPHRSYLKIFQSDYQWIDPLQSLLNGNGTSINLNALHAMVETLMDQMGGAA